MPRRAGETGIRVDHRDLRILLELERNARMPWRQLARKLGVSEATVYLRVRRLEERGILRGYSALVDPSRLGLTHRAIVLMRVLVRGLDEARRAIPRMRYVSRVLEITGPYNLLVEVEAPGREELVATLRSLEGLEGVEEIMVLGVLAEVWRARSIIGDVLKIGGARSSESLRP